MARKIQHKRGLEANLPQLDEAEIAFTTDSKKPFIGSADGNIEIAKKKDVDEALANKANATTVQGLSQTVNAKADVEYVETELAKKADTTALETKADVTALETKADKEEVATLSAQLADKASQADVTAAVEPKADKTYVDTELGKKADTTYVDTKAQGASLTFKESYATLADLQAAYPTGDTFNHAVLADGMIYTYVNDAWTNTQIQANGTGIARRTVTPEKTTFIESSNNLYDKENVTEGIVISSSGAETANDSYITSGFIEVEPNTTYTVDQFNYMAEYDASRNFITRKAVWVKDNEDLRTFITSANTRYIRTSLNIYTQNINLAQVNQGSEVLPYEPYGQKLARAISVSESMPFNMDDFHGFFVGMPERLNFDFDNNRIVIATNAGRLVHMSGDYSLTEQTIDLSGLSGYYFKLIYNISAKQVRVIGYAEPVPDGHFAFAGMHTVTRSVFNIEHCYVNGKPKNITNESVRRKYTDEYFVVDGVLDGLYNAPAMESGTAGTPNSVVEQTSADMYALYDELMAAYPNYITKTLLGTEPTGLPIYRYDFKPPRPSVSNVTTKTPKIVIASGTHGPEKAAGWVTYLTLKELCENWDTNPLLETLRWNVHIVLVAMVNPWGWDNNSRKNSNGVDINRNFPSFWNADVDPSASEYGGPEPLSEVESRLVDNLLSTEKDVIFVWDFHNFSDTSSGFLWNPAGTTFNANISLDLISKLSRKWKKEQPNVPQDDNVFFGHVSGTPGGTIARHAANAYGLQSSTFEICQAFGYEEGGPVPFSSLALTMGVETAVNWLIMNVRNNVPLINSQRNIIK